MLFLAIHASAWLHNFVMNTERLSYAADESPELHFSEYF
jgi:hypothetical protein